MIASPPTEIPKPERAACGDVGRRSTVHREPFEDVTSEGFLVLPLCTLKDECSGTALAARVVTGSNHHECTYAPSFRVVGSHIDVSNFDYGPSGERNVKVTLDRQRTYTTSGHTYRIQGWIRHERTSGKVSYDLQVTGGALPPTGLQCKAGPAAPVVDWARYSSPSHTPAQYSQAGNHRAKCQSQNLS